MIDYARFKNYKNAPIGTLMPWSGSTSPSDVPPTWLVCNGDDFDPALYPELAEILGPVENNIYKLPRFQEHELREVSSNFFSNLGLDDNDVDRNSTGLAGMTPRVDLNPVSTFKIGVSFKAVPNFTMSGIIRDMTLNGPSRAEVITIIPRKLGVDHTPSHIHRGEGGGRIESAVFADDYVPVFRPPVVRINRDGEASLQTEGSSSYRNPNGEGEGMFARPNNRLPVTWYDERALDPALNGPSRESHRVPTMIQMDEPGINQYNASKHSVTENGEMVIEGFVGYFLRRIDVWQEKTSNESNSEPNPSYLKLFWDRTNSDMGIGPNFVFVFKNFTDDSEILNGKWKVYRHEDDVSPEGHFSVFLQKLSRPINSISNDGRYDRLDLPDALPIYPRPSDDEFFLLRVLLGSSQYRDVAPLIRNSFNEIQDISNGSITRYNEVTKIPTTENIKVQFDSDFIIRDKTYLDKGKDSIDKHFAIEYGEDPEAWINFEQLPVIQGQFPVRGEYSGKNNFYYSNGKESLEDRDGLGDRKNKVYSVALNHNNYQFDEPNLIAHSHGFYSFEVIRGSFRIPRRIFVDNIDNEQIKAVTEDNLVSVTVNANMPGMICLILIKAY